MLMPEKDRNYMLFHDLLKLYFNTTINEPTKSHFLNNQTMTLTVNTTRIQEYHIQRVCCSFDYPHGQEDTTVLSLFTDTRVKRQGVIRLFPLVLIATSRLCHYR